MLRVCYIHDVLTGECFPQLSDQATFLSKKQGYTFAELFGFTPLQPLSFRNFCKKSLEVMAGESALDMNPDNYGNEVSFCLIII